MRIKSNVRRLVQRFGLDIVRYPLASPLARTVKMLDHHDVDCVVDVGANTGGFASTIRRLGYTGRIISFEPLQQQYDVLRRASALDPNWEAIRLAIGDCAAKVKINVSANDGLSSSVLPMLDRHSEAAPNSRFIGAETVDQDRLDSILPSFGIDRGGRTFLKIDVQGYERHVLSGAAQLFSEKKITGLQMELSLVPLYGGAMTYREGLDFAETLGMDLMGLDPVFSDPRSGQLLQLDAVFFQSS